MSFVSPLSGSGGFANAGTHPSCEDTFNPMSLFSVDEQFHMSQPPLEFDNFYQPRLSPSTPAVVPNYYSQASSAPSTFVPSSSSFSASSASSSSSVAPPTPSSGTQPRKPKRKNDGSPPQDEPNAGFEWQNYNSPSVSYPIYTTTGQIITDQFEILPQKIEANTHFSATDNAWICYRQNQFKVTCNLKSPSCPTGSSFFVQDNGAAVPVVQLCAKLYAIKEITSAVGEEMRVGLHHVGKSRVKKEKLDIAIAPFVNGRVEFANVQFERSNAVKGQQLEYFHLVIAFYAKSAAGSYYHVFSRMSMRLIVRSQNPGFYGDNPANAPVTAEAQEEIKHSPISDSSSPSHSSADSTPHNSPLHPSQQQNATLSPGNSSIPPNLVPSTPNNFVPYSPANNNGMPNENMFGGMPPSYSNPQQFIPQQQFLPPQQFLQQQQQQQQQNYTQVNTPTNIVNNVNNHQPNIMYSQQNQNNNFVNNLGRDSNQSTPIVGGGNSGGVWKVEGGNGNNNGANFGGNGSQPPNNNGGNAGNSSNNGNNGNNGSDGNNGNNKDSAWQQYSDVVVHHGKVGINTSNPVEALTVNGSILVTGNVYKPSDRRIKTNIIGVDTESQLDHVRNLKIYDYVVRSQPERGVIAQELQAIMPNAVHTVGTVENENQTIPNLLVVNERVLLYENIGATQQLDKELENEKQTIVEIDSRVAELKETTNKESNEVKDKIHNLFDVLFAEENGDTFMLAGLEEEYLNIGFSIFRMGPPRSFFVIGFLFPWTWSLGALYVFSNVSSRRIMGISNLLMLFSFLVLLLCTQFGFMGDGALLKVKVAWVLVGSILLLSNYIRMRARLQKKMKELEGERQKKAELVKQLEQARKQRARIVDLRDGLTSKASIEILDDVVMRKKTKQQLTQEKQRKRERKKATQKAKEEAERRRKQGTLV